MLGSFRLILAILVAMSHADFRLCGLNPGVFAVVCFYLISGYVMTGLLRVHYAGWRDIPAFFADRGLRLLPQYFALACLTLMWFNWSQQNTAFLQHSPGSMELLANVLVVPLNYFMFNHSDQFTLIPPAWSLGAEIQFYLLIPLILLLRVRWLVLLGSLLVFVSAAWGMIHTDYYGYRLLPGVLVFFMLGSYLYDYRERPVQRKTVCLVALLAIVAGVAVLQLSGHLQLPYNRETLLGAGIGIPLLYFLGRLPQRAWDNRLGDLSYGVFLNHFLLQWSLIGKPHSVGTWVLYIGSSLVLSYLTQKLIERPVLQWRKKLRKA
ncbi:acyltransferase family protein [Undibacterium flavidum]|uniref:Acyltransferase n=1 Tax=Undibacterium flavidum TaxID=2762297 RepID=A0ABR6Y8V4_9BURK|nr:acyltransferase [Undibacterium flavidum]MBC3873058.1 acyltransferase [Undibacterium flavidum]